MDSSDWVGLVYVSVALLAFPFAVRLCWKNEIELAKRRYYQGYDPELHMAGFYAVALCFFWPLVVVYWIFMGLLALLTVGIKESNGTD